ncbi:subtilase family protease [Prauserella sp. Am3]|nr:subtilase family protease [Prauserella sp. Am3]
MLGRANVLLACAVLVLTGHLAATAPARAQGGETCHTDSRAWRYVVLFDEGTSPSDAERVVRSACGALTEYYDDIAVAIATSADPDFDRVVGTDRAFSAQRARYERAHGSTAEAPSATAEGATDDRTGDFSGEQWDMQLTGARLTPVEPAGLDDVTVGVLDSGIDAGHPDLADAIDPDASAGCLTGVPDRRPSAWSPGPAESSTAATHGTHVAGIVGAADDGHGVTGAAPGTRLASVRVVDDDGYVTPEAAVCGYLWAAHNGIDVTNASFTVAPSGVACAASEGRKVVHEAVARAVEFADRSGTLNVAAATNDGLDLAPLPHSDLHHAGDGNAGDGNDDGGWDEGRSDLARACVAVPAALQETLTVSAVDRHGTKADYSSYGRGVIDLAAPGGSDGDCVLSTVPGGYDRLCGTSMAAPHVASAAAVLAADRSEDRSPAALRRMLLRQAQPIDCPADARETGTCTGPAEDNAFHGRGLVGAHAAHAVHRLLVRLGGQH